MENEIKKRLNDLPFEHLFKTDLDKKLTEKFTKDPLLCYELIEILEEELKVESVHFWSDLCRPNFLLYLYRMVPLYENRPKSDASFKDKAEELFNKCKDREPTNVTTLVCRAMFLLKLNRTKESRTLIDEQLGSEVKKPDFIGSIPNAEVAFCLNYFGPVMYMKVIELYEQSISEIRGLVIKKDEERKVVMWKFHLAQTYNRMLNKGNQTLLTTRGGNFDEAIARIDTLLEQVVDSGHPDFIGKAYIEMSDADKKIETLGIAGVQNKRLPYLIRNHLTQGDCVSKALKIAPQDVYVLERCGRHYRQKATCVKDFQCTIEILEKALAINPKRHVVCHHIGLSYKSIWLEQEQHDESRLHTNRAKVGHKKSVRKKRLEHQVTLPPRVRGLDSLTSQNRKKPDYFDRLRINNPKCKMSNHPELLHAAEYLVRANSIKRSCRYLIDLARVCISLDRHGDARKYFYEAKDIKDRNDSDSAYLYEQLALFEDGNESEELSKEDVMELYRDAIRFAVQARIRSKMAFYKLRDHLIDQRKTNVSDRAVLLELKLLYNTMQQYEKSEQCLLQALNDDPENVTTTWEFICLLHMKQTQADAVKAFVYLTSLAEAKKLTPYEVCTHTDDQLLHSQVILDIMLRLMDKEDLHATKVVFGWFAGTTAMKYSSSFMRTSSSDMSDDDVLVVGSRTELMEAIKQSLEKAELRVSSLLTILPNQKTIKEMRELIARSKAIVIVVDSEGENWDEISVFWDDFMSLKTRGFPLCAVFDKTSKLVTPYCPQNGNELINMDSVMDTLNTVMQDCAASSYDIPYVVMDQSNTDVVTKQKHTTTQMIYSGIERNTSQSKDSDETIMKRKAEHNTSVASTATEVAEKKRRRVILGDNEDWMWQKLPHVVISDPGVVPNLLVPTLYEKWFVKQNLQSMH